MSVEGGCGIAGTPGVKSAMRTLQILELFDEIQRPMNVAKVSETLGYPHSSTAALLRSLVVMGYLHYDSKARTFVSTDRVSLLGSWISPKLFEEGSLPRLLREIGKRTGQMVLLAARNGDFAQYIHVLNTPGNVPHHIHIGDKRQLATSGVGQMLLSSMTDDEVRRLFHRMNAYARTPQNTIDIKALIARLGDIRKTGYAFSKHLIVSGFGVIAVGLPQDCTNRPLSIGVCGFCEVLENSETEIVATLREEMARYLRPDARQEAPLRTPHPGPRYFATSNHGSTSPCAA